jgi:hypothetical protein
MPAYYGQRRRAAMSDGGLRVCNFPQMKAAGRQLSMPSGRSCGMIPLRIRRSKLRVMSGENARRKSNFPELNPVFLTYQDPVR